MQPYSDNVPSFGLNKSTDNIDRIFKTSCGQDPKLASERLGKHVSQKKTDSHFVSGYKIPAPEPHYHIKISQQRN
jgi:hypothetical protein